MKDLESSKTKCETCKKIILKGETIISFHDKHNHKNCILGIRKMNIELKIKLSNGETYYHSFETNTINFSLDKIKEIVIRNNNDKKSFINSLDLKDEIDSIFLNTINE